MRGQRAVPWSLNHDAA